MRDLDRFKKKIPDEDCHVSSVNIKKAHKKFIEDNNLNLSMIIRDYLDSLILENQSESKKKK